MTVNPLNRHVSDDFADITIKRIHHDRADSNVKKIELNEKQFTEDSYNISIDFAKDWLDLSKYILGILSSVDEVNKQFRSLNIDYLTIDKNLFINDVSLLYEIKSFQHLVNSLSFSKKQRALIMENYINNKMQKVPSSKKFDIEQLKSIFEKLSGKQ